jgi:hypothetical protein
MHCNQRVVISPYCTNNMETLTLSDSRARIAGMFAVPSWTTESPVVDW